MVVLALDTTSPSGSVAVLRGGDLLVERSSPPGVPHGKRLPGEILAALDTCRLPLREVELYAVASGPGAFTGLRVGIATIQGLAFAEGRPVVGVSALDALAHAALAQAGRPEGRIAAWMDAARNEVFSALYEVSGGSLRQVEEPSVGTALDTLGRWREALTEAPVVFIGEGALRYADAIRDAVPPQSGILPPPPLAGTIARLALAHASEGKAGPPHAVRPLYVRRPDAELARQKRAQAQPDHA